MKCTNQKSSGRCWLFAATNIIREKMAKELDLENFELSQSYLAFWDKLEKCNWYYENIIDTAALDTDDRVSFRCLYARRRVTDGWPVGYFRQYHRQIRRRAAKSAYPETGASSSVDGRD
jgi:bleomycin hydrolase